MKGRRVCACCADRFKQPMIHALPYVGHIMPGSTHPSDQLLAGASIIVTRPPKDAVALVRAARASGAHVVLLPGIEVSLVDDTAAARAALLAAKSADRWIFTSPNSVRFCVRLLRTDAAADWPAVLAVGEGTRRVLARHGIAAIAPQGAQNSEGLLADRALADVEGQAIAIIDAPGGRDLLAPSLRKRGARVDRIGVYQRKPPSLRERHFSALADATRPWISLVSSSLILNNLFEALPQELRRRWQQEALVVSSARIAEQAHQLGFSDVHEARSALVADLLEAACLVLSRHRF